MNKKIYKLLQHFLSYFEKCWNPVRALYLKEEPSTVEYIFLTKNECKKQFTLSMNGLILFRQRVVPILPQG